PAKEHPPGLEPHRHLRQRALHRPQRRARISPPLPHVGDRFLQRSAPDAVAPGGDADPAAVEDAQRLLVAPVLLADQLAWRPADVVEDHLGGVARPEAELLDLPPGAEAGPAGLDDEDRK